MLQIQIAFSSKSHMMLDSTVRGSEGKHLLGDNSLKSHARGYVLNANCHPSQMILVGGHWLLHYFIAHLLLRTYQYTHYCYRPYVDGHSQLSQKLCSWIICGHIRCQFALQILLWCCNYCNMQHHFKCTISLMSNLAIKEKRSSKQKAAKTCLLSCVQMLYVYKYKYFMISNIQTKPLNKLH